MRTELTTDDLAAWLAGFHARVTENRTYLTELDSAIGDADHGANMARGMSAVMEKVQGLEAPSIETLFTTVGMTLVSSVGGASGPLYGTFFLRFAKDAGPRDELGVAALASALRAGFEGVLARGKAEPGDKTMVDALGPALDAMDAVLDAGGLLAETTAAARDAAATGRDATEPLVARKGRASYLGERSAGHLDPGATSTALLFDALAEVAAQ